MELTWDQLVTLFKNDPDNRAFLSALFPGLNYQHQITPALILDTPRSNSSFIGFITEKVNSGQFNFNRVPSWVKENRQAILLQNILPDEALPDWEHFVSRTTPETRQLAINNYVLRNRNFINIIPTNERPFYLMTGGGQSSLPGVVNDPGRTSITTGTEGVCPTVPSDGRIFRRILPDGFSVDDVAALLRANPTPQTLSHLRLQVNIAIADGLIDFNQIPANIVSQLGVRPGGFVYNVTSSLQVLRPNFTITDLTDITTHIASETLGSTRPTPFYGVIRDQVQQEINLGRINFNDIPDEIITRVQLFPSNQIVLNGRNYSAIELSRMSTEELSNLVSNLSVTKRNMILAVLDNSSGIGSGPNAVRVTNFIASTTPLQNIIPQIEILNWSISRQEEWLNLLRANNFSTTATLGSLGDTFEDFVLAETTPSYLIPPNVRQYFGLESFSEYGSRGIGSSDPVRLRLASTTVSGPTPTRALPFGHTPPVSVLPPAVTGTVRVPVVAVAARLPVRPSPFAGFCPNPYRPPVSTLGSTAARIGIGICQGFILTEPFMALRRATLALRGDQEVDENGRPIMTWVNSLLPNEFRPGIRTTRTGLTIEFENIMRDYNLSQGEAMVLWGQYANNNLLVRLQNINVLGVPLGQETFTDFVRRRYPNGNCRTLLNPEPETCRTDQVSTGQNAFNELLFQFYLTPRGREQILAGECYVLDRGRREDLEPFQQTEEHRENTIPDESFNRFFQRLQYAYKDDPAVLAMINSHPMARNVETETTTMRAQGVNPQLLTDQRNNIQKLVQAINAARPLLSATVTPTTSVAVGTQFPTGANLDDLLERVNYNLVELHIPDQEDWRSVIDANNVILQTGWQELYSMLRTMHSDETIERHLSNIPNGGTTTNAFIREMATTPSIPMNATSCNPGVRRNPLDLVDDFRNMFRPTIVPQPPIVQNLINNFRNMFSPIGAIPIASNYYEEPQGISEIYPPPGILPEICPIAP